MAYWFHRNPLKATAPVTFELRGAATNGQAQKICRFVVAAVASVSSGERCKSKTGRHS